MANAKVWKNVAVAMQSAIAAAKTITSISKANPAVLQVAAHGFANGDIVYVETQGMRQVNERVFRVSLANTGDFALEGEDSTLFDDFSTGTVQKLTMGTSITTATSISASGGDFEMIDTTTIHAAQKSQIPGLPNPSVFNMDHIHDISDAGLKAMKAACDNQQKRAFCFQFGSGGQKMYFVGYVGASLLPGGQAQQLVTTPTAITMNGSPTYYAS